MIIEPVKDANNNYSYSGTFYYVEYFNSDNWQLGKIENATINSPRKLFINTDVTTHGRIDLITYVEQYTP